MKKQDQIFDQVTNLILEQLENGTVPWQREWRLTTPFNFATGRAYRGINVWCLASYPFQSPAWLTFRQIQKLGFKVIKGSKSAPVLFWKMLEVTDSETGEKKNIPFPKIYRVFNTEQVDGIEYKPEECPYELLDSAEEIIRNYQGGPTARESQNNRCYYHPKKDEVFMVPMNQFINQESYYATLFHELVHSTGHSKRLDRGLDTEFHSFDDPVYSKEELIAELGAAQLSARCGIFNKTIDNSAAYIQGWLSLLSNDRSLIIQASQKAQKAVDYITGYVPKKDEVD